MFHVKHRLYSNSNITNNVPRETWNFNFSLSTGNYKNLNKIKRYTH